MSSFSKRWEDLQFYDNYIFCRVMEEPEMCRRMLEILLGIEIEKIEYLVSERHIETEYTSRGVRLDIFVKNSDRIFNLEMQTGDYADIQERARYYHSAMDIDETERGIYYRNLKENYVLFICLHDPFTADLPIYTRKTSFFETDIVPYDDKTHTVFYNTSAYDKAEDSEVRAVLKFISTLKTDSAFTRELEHTVERVKSDRDHRSRYMTVAQEIEWEKTLSFKEGEQSMLLQMIKVKLAKNKSPEQIADEIELSLEKTLELINQVS